MTRQILRQTLRQTLLRRPGAVMLAAAGAAAGLAVVNQIAARWAEWRHPPRGRFIEVDGVRLHYLDVGRGNPGSSPVVLVHGNIVSAADYETSGVIQRLAARHRVIAFDRPGCGYSTRPRGEAWSAARQAELLRRALWRLGVHRPVLAGHSWGAMVALEMALRNQADTAGLVLISGYYFASVRLDALLVAPAAVPVLGTLLRNTVSPLLGWLTMPLLKRALFAPAPVTPRFAREYAPSMALRPSQLHASAADGVRMVPAALALRRRYKGIYVPTTIVAGDGDRVVFKRQAERLHRAVPGSALRIVPGMGHMLHHCVPDQIAGMIEAMAEDGAVTSRNRAPV